MPITKNGNKPCSKPPDPGCGPEPDMAKEKFDKIEEVLKIIKKGIHKNPKTEILQALKNCLRLTQISLNGCG